MKIDREHSELYRGRQTRTVDRDGLTLKYWRKRWQTEEDDCYWHRYHAFKIAAGKETIALGERRGYPFKQTHLVALRMTKITASDPPSHWWPGEQ